MRSISNLKLGSAGMRFGVALCCYGLALLGSVVAGPPTELPDMAMDWVLLFHVERATVLVAGLGGVLLIAWRASRGDYPIRFGQIEYAVRKAAEDADIHEEALERRVRALEETLAIRDSSHQGVPVSRLRSK